MNQIKDYIIINITTEMSTQEIKRIMDQAIEKIKKETTFLTFILNLNYYFIFSYFSFFFNKVFIGNSLILSHNKLSYLVNKTFKMVVSDNGILIDTVFIPYENITTFCYGAGIITLDILASIENNEKIKVNLEKDKLTTISINCKNGINLVNSIKKNMYYHIRYNKINTDVMNYYTKNNLNK